MGQTHIRPGQIHHAQPHIRHYPAIPNNQQHEPVTTPAEPIPLGQRPPGTLRPLEDVLTLLTAAGFTREDALHTYRMLFAYLYGHILNELQEVIERPRKTITSSRSVCTGTRSPNSPSCAQPQVPSPPTTAPPNSTAASISCSPP